MSEFPKTIVMLLTVSCAAALMGRGLQRHYGDKCPTGPVNRAVQAAEFMGGQCKEAGKKGDADLALCTFPASDGGARSRALCGVVPGMGLECINPVKPPPPVTPEVEPEKAVGSGSGSEVR